MGRIVLSQETAVFLLTLAFLICVGSAIAQNQNAAPSSHMVFNDNFDGDIIVNQVRVPGTGEATYTYYETLGWRGTAAGYAGIQAHPNGHNFIFSIWDNDAHNAPIQAVYTGHGTTTEEFSGEGTGLKSWNFDLGWQTDTWITQVARSWAVGDHTYMGYWVSKEDTNQWYHLITMDVAVANARFQGGTDAFIEDWLQTGENARETQLKGGWKRKTNGDWFPFTSAIYSVNSWDLGEDGRSYNYRTNWDGGIASDEGDEYYFMKAGGAETTPTTTNPSTHASARSKVGVGFPEISISSGQATADQTNDILRIDWDVNTTTSPQFSYDIEVFDFDISLDPLVTANAIAPEARHYEFSQSSFNSNGPLVVQLTLTDIFGGSRTYAEQVATPIVAKPAPAGGIFFEGNSRWIGETAPGQSNQAVFRNFTASGGTAPGLVLWQGQDTSTFELKIENSNVEFVTCCGASARTYTVQDDAVLLDNSTLKLGRGGEPLHLVVNDQLSIEAGSKVQLVDSILNVGTLISSGRVDIDSAGQVIANNEIITSPIGEIHGNGTLQATGEVQNEGLLAPNGQQSALIDVEGEEVGTLHIDSAYKQTATGKLSIELSGPNFGNEGFDILTITGAANLDGTLDVTTINGFGASIGDRFDILTAASLAGTFATENLPILFGNIELEVVYSPTGVTLVAVPQLDGDFNYDGIVDAADYTVWRNNLGLASSALNGNGSGAATVVQADYLLWKTNFGESIASSSGADHVPEPTTLLLALLALACVPLRMRHG